MHDITIRYISVSLVLTFMMFVRGDDEFEKEKRRRICTVAILVILGTLLEYMGDCLQGKEGEAIHTLYTWTKALEFSLAPILTVLLVRIMDERCKQLKIAYGLLMINAIMACSSVFTKSIFFIDEQNIYHRADWYGIYVFAYMLSITFFVIKSKKFSDEHLGKDLSKLISIALFLVSSLMIQMFERNLKTDWLSISISLVFWFLYYRGLHEQKDKKLNMFNKKSYDEQIQKIKYETAVFIIDINDFKKINDMFGHQQGDLYIEEVAHLICKVFESDGYCFRIGGDEFSVILKNDVLRKYDEYENPDIILDQYTRELEYRVKKAQETDSNFPTLAVGYGIKDSNTTLLEAAKVADKLMYEVKENMHKGR